MLDDVGFALKAIENRCSEERSASSVRLRSLMSADDSREEMLPAGQGFAERHLQRDLGAVAAQARQLSGAPRQAGRATCQVLLEDSLVGVPEAFRYQRGQRHARQLLPVVAEHVFGRRVGEEDPAVRIDRDDGVRRGFGQRAVTLLRLANQIFRRFVRRDVHHDAAQRLRAAVFGFHRDHVLQPHVTPIGGDHAVLELRAPASGPCRRGSRPQRRRGPRRGCGSSRSPAPSATGSTGSQGCARPAG